MAFVPRNLYHSEGSFTPLFRLLEDFDQYSRKGPESSSASLQSWQPKFDVAETKDGFELHGELPGIKKEDVNVEFTGPQTIIIRGKTERTYTAGTPPSHRIEGASSGGAITDGAESPAEGQKSPVPSDSGKTASKQADKAKYWVSERSIGEFSRSFSFPSQVDQGAVTASFKDGILSLFVPKAKKHEARRIAIN